jgi:hypothetical protein
VRPVGADRAHRLCERHAAWPGEDRRFHDPRVAEIS